MCSGYCHFLPVVFWILAGLWSLPVFSVIFLIWSSVSSNRPALASIRSISQTFSLDRWWFIRCELMSALQLFKHTKSTHPRLLQHFPPVIAEKERDAAILSAVVIPAQCNFTGKENRLAQRPHSKSKRSVLAPKCWFSSIGPGADLTLRGAILSIWSKSTPIKTIAAPSKTVLAHRRNCFSHVMRIGPFHKSHFYSKNRDISGFSLVGPYLGLTWPILIELFRPHDNAKWLDH